MIGYHHLYYLSISIVFVELASICIVLNARYGTTSLSILSAGHEGIVIHYEGIYAIL